VHEEDPQTKTSSSSDLLDPPQGLPSCRVVCAHLGIYVVAQHLHAHHRHAHHLLNHIWSSDLNHDLVDEVVDDSPPGHSNSIFQPFPSMVLDDSELQTMESEWRHELDEILDSIDENVNINYQTSGGA
jgi:hypothetical protein